MDVSERLAGRVGEAFKAAGLTLVLAESCTGGWLARVVTSVPGCSAWFDRGFVAYSNAAKSEMLGVAEHDLVGHGAVSEAVVRAMALGALARSQADVAVAISGISGPGGGSPEKPVGTVWMAWARRDGDLHTRVSHFAGPRDMIRLQAVMAGLQGALEMAVSAAGSAPGDPVGAA